MESRERLSSPTGRPLIECNNRRNRRDTNCPCDDHSDIPIARCVLAGGGCPKTLDDLDLDYPAGTVDDNGLASQGVVNQPYRNTTLAATGGIQPYTWSVNPALPNGLQFNVVSSGTISGTPLAGTESTTNHTFTVTDSTTPINQTSDRLLSLTIDSAVPPLRIVKPTGDTLPNGEVNKPYSEAFEASGGTPPYAWSVSPALPDWLALDESTGSLTGTSPTRGTFSRIYTVHDSTLPTNLIVSRSISLRIRN